jgi:hypothetical protein
MQKKSNEKKPKQRKRSAIFVWFFNTLEFNKKINVDILISLFEHFIIFKNIKLFH